jgi:hypothetical protein
VTVTVPVTVPVTGTVPELPQLEDELLLEPLELPQHMLELELLVDADDDEPTLEPELDPELPHDRVGLSTRAARRCKPNAEASCGRTVIKSTKLATAITGTCARRRQVFMWHLALDRLGLPSFFAAPYLPA